MTPNDIQKRTPWVAALEGVCMPWELDELKSPAGVADAFSRDVSFGTGGIRALMGIGPNRLNNLTVARAAAGLAAYLQSTLEHSAPLVVIAYDTRHHSRDFALIAARVLAAAGCRTLVFTEPQPTPVLSFATRELGAAAGIVLTASHNPRDYNGFKVYDARGCQATDGLARAIQKEIGRLDPFVVPLADLEEAQSAGTIAWVAETIHIGYLEAVKAQLTGVDLSNISVAYSPLNGTGLTSACALLDSLGVKNFVVADQAAPDGDFPTCPKPNPEHLAAMRAVEDLAIDTHADLAIANDPDADRIGVSVRHDEAMRLLTGDEVGLLLLDYLCEVLESSNASSDSSAVPTHPVAATTIVSSPLLDTIADAHGIELRRTLTGFKYIGEQMCRLEDEGRASDFICGIEESCGYLRGTYARDKDGIIALGLVCELAAFHKAQGRDLVQALDALYARYGYMVSRQVSVELPGTEGRAAIATLMDGLRANPPISIGGLATERVTDYAVGAPMPGDSTQTLPASNVLTIDLDRGCRVIVRPSGTEPKIKAYCFACSRDAATASIRLDAMAEDVASILNE